MRRALLGLLLAAGCHSPSSLPVERTPLDEPATPEGFSAEEVRAVLRHSPLPPLPADPTNRYANDPRAARLGQSLFYETRLSAGGDVGCVTCHAPEKGWGDGRSLPVGDGDPTRHAMTLWNVAYNRWFFWDGRADSLWSQALQPIENPKEHGSSRVEAVRLLGDDPELRRAYAETFGEPPPDLSDRSRFPERARPVPDEPDHADAKAWIAMESRDRDAVDRAFVNLGKALAAFERRIVSRRSPFDVFVEGIVEGDGEKLRALDDAQQRGLRLFVGKARCNLCHSGPGFTDLEFHDTGVPPLHGGKRTDSGRYRGIDLVRADPFNGIGDYSDEPDGAARDKVDYLARLSHNWSEFKTPSLRNVASTAPYMHQGQHRTLREVLEYYNTLEGAVRPRHGAERILVPLGLTDDELDDLEAFLGSLSGPPVDPALAKRPPGPRLE